MSAITLEVIEAKQSELVALIAKYKSDAPRILTIGGVDVALRAAEHYSGEVLNADGSLKHRLVLVSVSDDTFEHDDAMAHAEDVDGASAPDRQEAALLIANCKPHLPTSGWFWTSERHATNASCAWGCDFGNGYQGYGDKSSAGSAVAVRRLIP